MKIKLVLIVVVAAFLHNSSFAVSSGLGRIFGTGASKQQGGSKKPTIIDSDTMDMDLKTNIIIFVGNVVVDSEKLHITCERMEMYVEVVEVNGKEQKELREIHCYKNREGKLDANDPTDKRVVIVRNLPEKEVKENGIQQSFSGKAVYNVKTGEVVLTDEPIMVQGVNEIHGTKITMWRDSDQMNVEDVHIRYIDQDDK